MTALAYALALAGWRIPTFPCLANKAPACRDGFKAATADPEALRELWHRHPGELIGVPTGPLSGFDVLDIDPRHGGDRWEQEHARRLPQTRVHVTRSGGRHYLLRSHDGVRNSASKLAPGVDIRAGGGYIIWWPHAGLPVPVRGPIAHWPEWVLAILFPPPAPPPEPVLRAAKQSPSEDTAARFLAAVLRRVETAPAGERHPRLRNAARSIGGVLGQLGISAATAERALFDAVRRAGGDAVDEDNARATITWGLAQGAAVPIALGTRNGR